ncbi:hypothetical protein HZ326_21969 [Fusarium oxysporum f. sp. albedinis]|nr:hypothetical protein HZ326_21969 [Fusarium oxysporum f. sp. albedinis]
MPPVKLQHWLSDLQPLEPRQAIPVGSFHWNERRLAELSESTTSLVSSHKHHGSGHYFYLTQHAKQSKHCPRACLEFPESETESHWHEMQENQEIRIQIYVAVGRTELLMRIL